MAAPDYNAIYAQALQQQQQAAQPAISALQATQPSLEARYKSILDQLTGREQTEVAGQQRTTSREFGRRGIPLSSGVFDVTLGQQIQPISQYYTGQRGQTGVERESAISQLAAQVAALQSGAGQSAVTQAQNMYQMQQQAWQQEQAQAQQAAQFAQSLAAQKAAGGGGGATSTYRPPAAQPTGTEQQFAAQINKWLGGGSPRTNFPTFVRDYAQRLSLNDIYRLYGKYTGGRFGAPAEDYRQMQATYIAAGGKL